MLALLLQLFLLLSIAFAILKCYKQDPVKSIDSLNRLPGENFVSGTQNIMRRINPTSKIVGPLSFPFIGGILQILFLGEREHNYEAYHKACKKYGKIMGFRGGNQDYCNQIILNSFRFPLQPPHLILSFVD